jgi:benzoate membrane transport protein
MMTSTQQTGGHLHQEGSPAQPLIDEPSTPTRLSRRSLAADLHVHNVAAGLTTGLWYAFGAIPLQLDVAAKLNLSPALAASWFCIVWLTGGLASLSLSWLFRQPLAITWTIPGLVFLGAAGARYSLPEIVGASLIAGLLIVVLGVLGIGERVMRWLPLPIVLGMFAGSILGYATGIFTHLTAEPITVGATLGGYLFARALGRAWLPPIGGAFAAGLLAAALTGRVHPEGLRWAPPAITVVSPAFQLESVLALAIPLVVMAVGIGNVQGIGLLVSQGYRPPITLLTIVIGLNSIVNALFGGHPSTVARTGVAMVAGEEAGPPDQRYVASLVAAVATIVIALSATMATTLLEALPMSLVASLAGLAILSSLMEALRKSVVSDLPMGAFFAFAIAASPLSILGLSSAFWALVGGLLVALAVERRSLLQHVGGR